MSDMLDSPSFSKLFGVAPPEVYAIKCMQSIAARALLLLLLLLS